MSSIKNASGVAGTILTVESVVLEKKSEKEENAADPMMGMGM
jgi:chaperonin GroEL (HSP60 family)